MPRPRQRVRLESGLKLDLNELLRDGFGKPGEQRARSITWTRIPGDVPLDVEKRKSTSLA